MAAPARLENEPHEFLFLDLPPEVQDVVVSHMLPRDVLRFQQVSHQCHRMASRRVWESLSFYLEPSLGDTLMKRGRESRLMEALQTLICSKYDYAQHIRSFALRGFSCPTDNTLHRFQSLQLRYLLGSPAQQAISVALLTLIHKASSLESFAFQVPLSLTEGVWQRLTALKSLSSLTISMLGDQMVTGDPSVNHIISEYSLLGSCEGGHLPCRHIADFANLRSLTLTHINNSKHIEYLARCVKHCMSTLVEVHLSISETWFNEARSPTAQTSIQTPIQADSLLLDEPDDVSISEEDVQPVANQVATKAEKDKIRSNKTAQESLLAQIFSLESTGKCDRLLKKALKLDSDTKLKKPAVIDESAASRIPEVIQKFLKGGKLDSSDTELIDKLRSQLNQASKSRKKARVEHSFNSNNTKAFLSPLNPSASQSAAYFPYKPMANMPYGMNHQYSPSPLTQPTASQIYAVPSPYLPSPHHHLKQLHYLNGHQKYYVQPAAASGTSHTPGAMLPFGSASQKPASSFLSSMTSATDANQLSSHDALEVLEFTPLSHTDLSASSSNASDFTKSPKAKVVNTAQDIAENEKAYEHMNVDIEHPDEISGESGEDQESEEELEAPPKATAMRDKAKSKEKEEAMERPASPSKRARPVDSEPQSLEETVKRWVTESHGLALKRFSLYLIPLKASVLARALQIRLLQEIVLLGVGGQAPFWQLLVRASKEGELQLKSIQTDDVSRSFTESLSHLRSLEVLILRKRGKKDKFNTTTKEVASLSEICKAIGPHVGSLKVLAIRNDEDSSWNMRDDMNTMLMLRAKNLEEFSFRVALPFANEILLPLLRASNMPKLKAIHMLSTPGSAPAMMAGPQGSTTASLYNSYSNNIAGLINTCIGSRRACGDKNLQHVGIECQVYAVIEEDRPPSYPDWLVKNFEERRLSEPANKNIDDWAREIGYQQQQVTLDKVALSSVEGQYKIFSSQVFGAWIS